MNAEENCRDAAARRRLIREHARRSGSNEPNGIDYVEVGEGQKVITVFFLNKAPRDLEARNVHITGGVRVRDISVTRVALCELEDPDRDDCMKVYVDKPGDFSTYTLRLVSTGGSPLEGFDPRYSQIAFSFKANCPSDLDCAPQETCYKEPLPEPDIDYLAKDYASFRQLIYDRLSLVLPDWRERHVPDVGVALVELLAYVGDYLSYYQDAVATEAYLDTARLRISVRRHARLVDYLMHEGCNARTWVCVAASYDVTFDDPTGFYFITDPGPALVAGRSLTGEDLSRLAPDSYEVFEPLLPNSPRRPVSFYEAHNRIEFYTWLDRECCLPRGATSATLKDGWEHETRPAPPPPVGGEQPAPVRKGDYEQGAHAEGARASQSDAARAQTPASSAQQAQGSPRRRRLRLKPGDVLVFEEVRGPKTGDEADADHTHRHVVRLTAVEPSTDPLDGQPIVYVEWAEDDALPFALCISSVGEPPGCEYIENVSVARGNVALADHGRTVGPEELLEVSPGAQRQSGCKGPFEPREPVFTAGRFRPVLRRGPVTHGVPFPDRAAVTRAQSLFLGRLLEEVRRRVEQLWHRARRGHALSRVELAELETIFGPKTLARVGLAPGAKERQQQSAHEQAAALGSLVARFDDFTSKKARRVESLRRYLLGGYVLTDEERDEAVELFGPVAADGLQLMDALSLGTAASALLQQPREALPAVSVCRAPGEEDELQDYVGDDDPCWQPRRSLLESGARDQHFVAEMDDDGRAHLRFGDGDSGRAPEPGETLRAVYRVGNGAAGNIGADAIRYIVFRQKTEGASLTARNPLPARGGVNPEAVADVKTLAPGAVRKDLQRAVIAEDYARLAERARPDKVQRAAAELNWAGSWYEARTTVDPRGTEDADPSLLGEIEGALYRYRRIGYDLSTAGARYVPLAVALEVCVLPHYLRGHVKAALLDAFSNRVLPGGRRGFFHPDNLSFGESVYLSRLVAAAQGVEGVESVRVAQLERQYEGPKGEIEDGVLPIGPLEVARLDNDPNYPEHGQLVLDVRGGR